MTRGPSFTSSRVRYATETRDRMATSITDLVEMRCGRRGDVGRLRACMQQQEEASRRAGFEHVARLCQTMAECLDGVRDGEQPSWKAVADTVLDVCRAVKNHANGIAATVIEDEPESPSECPSEHGKGPTTQ